MSVTLLSSTNGKKGSSAGNSYPTKSITETIVNGFFTMNRNWTVTYWNKAAEKLLGVPASDIIGKNLWEQFAGIIPIEFYVVYPKAFLLHLPYHFHEYWGEMGAWFDIIVYNTDDVLSVSFKNSNYPVAPNHPDHPEERLKIQNELYRFVAEVSNDCLWEWDLQTNEIFWIDGGHKKVFGYDIENAFIPRTFWESRIHSNDRKRVLAGLDKVINDGACKVWSEDYQFQRASGEFAYVHDKGFIIYDESRQPSRMIGTTLDVTSERLTEIKLAETEKKLLLAGYLLSMQGNLVSETVMEQNPPANVANAPKDDDGLLPVNEPGTSPASPFTEGQVHDIKNALGAISMCVKLLEPENKDGEEKELLDVIMRSVTRIDHIIDKA